MTQICPRPPTAHTKEGPRTSSEALRWTLTISGFLAIRIQWQLPACGQCPLQGVSAQFSRIARASISKRCVSTEVGRPRPCIHRARATPTYAEFGYSSSSRALLCSEPCMCTFKITTCTSRIKSTPGHCSILKPLLIATAAPSTHQAQRRHCW